MAFKIKYESEYMLPIAIAGNDTVVAPGMTVAFSGQLSLSQTTSTLTYDWKLLEKPASSTSTLSNTTQRDIEFTPDLAGTYKISLTVFDGQNYSIPDVVTVGASNRPVAVLGKDTTVTFGVLSFYCDGSNSYDMEGDPISYSWKLIAMPEGSKGKLSQTDQPIALLRLDKIGTFKLELTVNDGYSNSDPDTIKITVQSTGINESELSSQITVFPNPTNGEISIKFTEPLKVDQMEILDMTGRVIPKLAWNEQASEISWNLNNQNMQPGIYFIKLSIGKQMVYKTFILNK